MPTKRADGRWQTSYVDKRTGKREIIYARKRNELSEKKAAILEAIDREIRYGLMGSPDQRVGDFLEAWLNYRKSSVRTKTLERYASQVRLHAMPAIGDVVLRELTPQHLAHAYGVLLGTLSPATVQQLHAILHSALKTAVKWRLIPANPAESVEAPRAGYEAMKWLTEPEVRTFLSGLEGDPLRPLYVLAIGTGMRQGEILGLRWQDVDLEAATLRVVHTLIRTQDGYELSEPKTKHSRRRIALPEVVVASLRQHRLSEAERLLGLGVRLDQNTLIFTDQYGEPIYGSHLTERHFKPKLRELGLPEVRFHDLRHTAATLLLEQGVHVKVVSEMLGHSSVQITLDRYSHVIPTIQEEAARRMNRVLTGA